MLDKCVHRKCSDCLWRRQLCYWSEKEGDLLFTVNSCTLGILYHVHLSPIQKMNKIKTKQNIGTADKSLGCVFHTPEKKFWYIQVYQVDIKKYICTNKYLANIERKPNILQYSTLLASCDEARKELKRQEEGDAWY